MSTATLNVWITQRGDPCRILNPTKENPNERFVYVLHCNGEPLVWCGKTYVGMQTKCGELEVEIPPGCYVVGAVEYTGGYSPLGNYLTHIAIVRANCGEHVCVTLFDPSLHFCGSWLGAAVNTHLIGGGGGPRPTPGVVTALQNAGQAMERLVKAIPADPFVVAQAKAIAIGTAPPRTTQAGASKGSAKKGRK